IHRDISPSNILVDDTGAQPVAKIIDFGISKEVNREHSISSQLIGKPQYMAPEQYRPKVYGENEKIDTRVDLWSFGMVAYELLSGKRIAQQLNLNTDSSGWIEDLKQADIDVCLETIAEPWRRVLQRCLVKHAAQRAKTADELLDLLNEKKSAPQEQGTQKTIVVPPEPPPPPSPRKLKWVKFFAAAATAGILLLFVANPLWEIFGIKNENEASVVYQKDSLINDTLNAALLKKENDTSVTDIDGNKYKTVKIGEQVWMAENLKTTHFNEGTEIPHVTANKIWENLESPAWCNFENKSSLDAKTGKLYNWYTVSKGDLCPTGWHVPSDDEWDQLIGYLGGVKEASNKMKSTTGWYYWEGWGQEEKIYSNGNNSSGFSGRMGGFRVNSSWGEFAWNYSADWWSSTQSGINEAWYRSICAYQSKVDRVKGHKRDGLSVRCIRD
ncbi:MAG: FISUMP domain-containing protein, partial [Bacteroidia bacterium]